MRVVVITGSRRGWPRPKEIFDLVGAADLLLVGDAPGVDELARGSARARGMAFDVFHAGWTRQGRSAGPLRNRRIAAAAHWYESLGDDDIVVECHAFPDANSIGTLDCIAALRDAGFHVEVHRP